MSAFSQYWQPVVAKTPQQVQQELSAILQNQYMPAYNALQQQQNIQSPILSQPSTSGIYDKVTSVQDVENYPTPTNGTAVLLFNYESGVFYSKKFVNGQSTIQPFKFIPLNSDTSSSDTVKPDISSNEVVVDPSPDTAVARILDTVEKLSSRIETLDKKVNGLRVKAATAKRGLLKEDTVDEL